MKKQSLTVTIAEISVNLRTAVADIAEIKGRLTAMDEQFARKDAVDKLDADIKELRSAIQTQEVKLAVVKAEFRTWGIVGGIGITLLSALISALPINL